METLGRIIAVQACLFDLITEKPLRVAAVAEVPTAGFSGAQLQPRVYITPPADGIWDFDFAAEKPAGIAIDVMSLISTLWDGTAPDWLKGVRVHGARNAMESDVIATLGAQVDRNKS